MDPDAVHSLTRALRSVSCQWQGCDVLCASLDIYNLVRCFVGA